jgi:hypothetical protein
MRKLPRLTTILTHLLVYSILLIGCAAPYNEVTPSDEAVSYWAQESAWAYFAQGDNMAADLFLVAPTVYLGQDGGYNMSLTDEATKDNFVGALNMEKGIYESSLCMYAPYYRQAALTVYEISSETEEYFEIAYEDVSAAFSYYLENLNDGRPFVLAGFSQGSDMCLRLLKDYFHDSDLQSQLIAAYLIGWRITDADLEENPHLVMASGEADTGVIVSFNSEAEDIESSIIVPDTTYGINPLNWQTDSTVADRSLNLGACFTNYSGSVVTQISEFCGAYLDPVRGTLKVTDVNPEDYPSSLTLFPTGVYHLYDYQFFYRNLQQNVQTRTNAYFQAHGA